MLKHLKKHSKGKEISATFNFWRGQLPTQGAERRREIGAAAFERKKKVPLFFLSKLKRRKEAR